LFAVAQHAVDQPGQHVGHGGDGFRCAEPGAQTPELGSQISLTRHKRRAAATRGSDGKE
jgi:hypothetical protein